MAANPIPNVGAISVAPPNIPAHLVAGLPAQGVVPTYNDVNAVDEALHVVKAAKNAQGAAVPASTVDYVNMLTYHHAVVQGVAGGGPVTLAQLQQVADNLRQDIQQEIRQELQNQTSFLRATLRAEQAKHKNDSARSATNDELHLPNVPIPKSCEGLAAPHPVPIPANRPAPNIGATKTLSQSGPPFSSPREYHCT